jgi:hypothetical protein
LKGHGFSRALSILGLLLNLHVHAIALAFWEKGQNAAKSVA